MLVSILTLASFIKVFHSAFMGPKLHDVKEVPKSMLLGMAVLTFVIIFFGVFPGWVVNHIVHPAAMALADKMAYIAAVTGGA